jgi:hypothetical protein
MATALQIRFAKDSFPGQRLESSGGFIAACVIGSVIVLRRRDSL